MAGRTAFHLWAAWRYGHEDPYRLYRVLDSDYRPVWNPALPAERPRHPERVRRFMYGLGRASAIVDGKIDDKPLLARAARPQRAPADGKGVLLGPDGEPVT